MVLFENLFGAEQVEVLFAAVVPRQLGDGLEVGADHLRLHRLATHPGEAAELAIDLAPGFGGELHLVELQAQLGQLVGRLALAELVLDGLELLAEEDLALAIADLLLDPALDLLLGFEDVESALDVGEDQAQALLGDHGLEDVLALLAGEVEVAGDEIREPPRLRDALDHLLDGLLG